MAGFGSKGLRPVVAVPTRVMYNQVTVTADFHRSKLGDSVYGEISNMFNIDSWPTCVGQLSILNILKPTQL